MELRKELEQKVLETTKNHIVLELATGTGKTKLALEKMNQLYYPNCKILIVVPRNVLIQNWIDEFNKWGYADMLNDVTFVTYVSLPKMAGYWGICIMDEAHHLSERCQEALKSFHINHGLLLSATLKKEHRWFIERQWGKDVEWIKVNTKRAIDNNVLPTPKILLLPLKLDNTYKTDGTHDNYRTILYYPKKQWKKIKNIKKVEYRDRWKWKGSRTPYALKCTQLEYYNEMSGLIEWYKRKSHNPVMKNLWLHKCGERLQTLASWKITTVLDILSMAKNARSITFCASIEDSEILGIPCVNSKVGTYNLQLFNESKINKIACVSMLDEGANLTDCQVGIFNMLNSSSRLQVQRLGRILRHKKPIIVIPYFKNTRDEEIVQGIIEDYKGMTEICIDFKELTYKYLKYQTQE